MENISIVRLNELYKKLSLLSEVEKTNNYENRIWEAAESFSNFDIVQLKIDGIVDEDFATKFVKCPSSLKKDMIKEKIKQIENQ